ncbi:hypothetical protein NHQ30_011154 [Ciborinia camelliae]|nr:hypothetical protein NHQ30_011154 [Ciborinia camelliae]
MHSSISLLTLVALLPITLTVAAPAPNPLPYSGLSSFPDFLEAENSTLEARQSCSAVRIITARASTEAPGEGVIGALAAAIQAGTSQTVTRTAVVYPALLEPYPPSVASGVAAMTKDLTAAVNACPDQKIVLLGYSQGAECVGDVLGGGGGGLLGTQTPPVDPSIGAHVVAAIMMGDPRYLVSQTAFHVGTCFQNGLFPRGADQSLANYNNILKSYCDFGDPFCCSGVNVVAHLDYVTLYNGNALQFVLGKIGN